MDTRMIDVAIGLALVFALTSLFVTALQEVFSSSSQMRGRVMKQALSSFFGDDKDFAQAILDHPLLVSLSAQPQAERDKRRPSYIEAGSVVTALLAHLTETHAGNGRRPSTPLELVELVDATASGAQRLVVQTGPALLAGATAQRPNLQFVRGLRALVQGVESDWPAFEHRLAAWYDSVVARSTGWFKRKTQAGVFVLGLLTAAFLNIDPLYIAVRLWNDAPLREAMVAAGKQIAAEHAASSAGTVAMTPMASDSKASAPAAVRADAKVTQAHKVLETAVADAARAGTGPTASLVTLNRAMQDFEKALKSWQQAGGGAAEPAVRDLVAQLPALTAAAPAEPSLAALRERTLALADETRRAVPLASTGDSKAARPSSIDRSSRALCGPASSAGAASDAASAAAWDQMCQQLDQLGKLQAAGLPLGWPRNDLRLEPDKGSFWGSLLLMALGWLATALACTLGAPFWFDSLSRLVRLRGSGAAPATTTAAGTTPTLMTRSDSTVAAGAATATDGAVMSDALNDAERRLTTAEVQRLQRGLPIPEIEVTGFFDGNTRRAIQAWQTTRQYLPATGELSEAQIRELLAMRTTTPAGSAAASAPTAPPHDHADDDHDGCDVPIANPTEDHELPAARGGVEGS
ncbi:peptidoglycan-binding protein [Ideonella sp. 4Y16]|uniref:peptidoglycan-binding domain-containing protein n=1 Tax=Ideonella alba TaxID=2824118 RepID=UPI001B35F1AE|nr:peptidoglycan-binding domain-containing protein [Ideonella alba]MBQ0946384.1 peptidoglycan-binding protein [Ideonella alba]